MNHPKIPQALTTKSHSTIVDRSCNGSHSIIVDRLSHKDDIVVNTQSNLQCYGVFHKYPPGILNPSFTGGILWELMEDHILNQYKLCPYHNIKSGVILYGNMAFIFTPISNNDIKSYLKILFRGKELPNGQDSSQVCKDLVDYIRYNAGQKIIPSISSIKSHLHVTFQIDETTFIDEKCSFLLLLKRIYTMTFMIHYQMPLQRKNSPGSRNTGTSPQNRLGKGWYCYLSKREQKILNKKNIIVATSPIPDDLINGVC